MESFVNYIPVLGALGLVFAFGLYWSVLRRGAGSDRMREIADSIHDGAMAFLRREYTILVGFVAVVALLQVGAADADWTCPVLAPGTMSHCARCQLKPGCSTAADDGVWCEVECEAGYYATNTWEETDPATGKKVKDSYRCHCIAPNVCQWRIGTPPHDRGCQPVQCPAGSPAPAAARKSFGERYTLQSSDDCAKCSGGGDV